MGLFGPKKVRCLPGVWTKIISNFGRGYYQEFHVTFTTDEGCCVTGTFIEKRYLWIFPQKPVEGPLTNPMVFHREWINGIYSVKVRVDTNAWATIR